MREYTYKRQTAKDIKLSEENEKAVQEFLKIMAYDIRRTVKELKNAGYTDEQIKQGFDLATSKLFYGDQSYRTGGIIASSFVPEIKVVDGVPVCVNGNTEESVINMDELKNAFGL